MAFAFTSPQQQQQPQQSPFQSPFQQSNLFQPQQQPQQQQQQSPFQLQLKPQQQQQQQQQQSPFQLQLQQPQQQQQQPQPQPQPQLYLFTNDKAPATYSTKWADLHPDSQKVLLQIEERILEYRDESQRLDQCSRLYDSSVSSSGFELDASYIVKDLGGINIAMERQKATLQELMTVVKDMLRNTEVAVRSFMMLRPKFHRSKGAAASASALSQALGSTNPQTSSNQPATSSMVPVLDFYSGLPKKPSPFLQQTIARFEKYLSECRQWIEELEQLLLLDSEKNSYNPNSSLLQSLPKVMANVHDFFVHVAAKVESIHQYIESMKTAYLADQRRRGDGNDPFLEADRRETAKQEAAARRVHPTVHLPAVPQPTSQASGSLAISAAPGPSTATNTTSAVVSASSGSGSSLFSTPAAATSTPSLFSTPTTSAPLSSLFATAASPQSSPFGALSTSTSAFGISTPLFSSTPASGVSNFSTPFATGAATGSGASFGTVSKARAKSRTGRRP